MAEATIASDPFLAQARAADRKLPGSGQTWVRELRRRGLDSYARQGWPSTKGEAWKHTNLAQVAKERFVPSAGAPRVGTKATAPYLFPGLDDARLVFVNGTFVPDLSTAGNAGPRARVDTLARALDGDGGLVREHLGRHLTLDGNPFAALNTASFPDGALVIVPERTKLATPIHCLYLTKPGREPVVTYPRTLVVAGRGSEVSVVETFAGDGKYLTNAATEIVAGESATVRHYRFGRESLEAVHLGSLHVRTERAAHVRSHNVCLGGGLTRNDVRAHFGGEGGEVLMNGLYVASGTQHVDNHTRVEHASPHCKSDQLYKGVLAGRSRGVFSGRIHVAKGAQGTDAYQHNPNLLLSDEALANSTPQLEIFADDVRCTHGSTTGHLDAQQVHYLRARGIGETAARTLLTYAFAAEVIDHIQIDAVREKLRDLVLERLPGGETVREALA